ERKMIGFIVDHVRYGIDIMQVREIVNPSEVIQVPASPSHVMGVADHRETVIPIIDLRIRFGLKETESTRRTKWIMTKTDFRDVGLQVDRVTQVIKMTDVQQRDRRSLLDNGAAVWIDEVFADNAGIVFRINLDAIVGPLSELPESEAFEGGGS
ncbi:MAG: hypothetical protein GY854_33555, partial [Deltaproteobacteria bacterium]|nr:hypothetical protein [Deltaproteobacteria bacterium]